MGETLLATALIAVIGGILVRVADNVLDYRIAPVPSKLAGRVHNTLIVATVIAMTIALVSGFGYLRF